MWFQPQVEVYMCGKLKRSHFSLIWCRHQELVTVFFFFFFNRLKNIDSYSEDFQKKNFRQIWWNCTNEYRLLLINPKEILLNWLFFLYPWFLCSSYFFSASSRAIAFRTWVWIVHTMRHWVSLEKEEKKVCVNDH